MNCKTKQLSDPQRTELSNEERLIYTVQYNKSVKNSWDISQLINSILQLTIKFNDHFKGGGSRGRQLAGDLFLTIFFTEHNRQAVVLSIILCMYTHTKKQTSSNSESEELLRIILHDILLGC